MSKEGNNGLLGSVIGGVTDSVAESIAASVSSLANSAMAQGKETATYITVEVCQHILTRWATQRSIVNTQDVRETGVDALLISPLISNMLVACDITVTGGVWVVCCPSDMGKTFAAEFLMHGDHGLRPERSLKIDATNMRNFPVDCAKNLLNCPLAAENLSLLLCKALSGQPKMIDKATNAVGQIVCAPQLMIPFDEKHPIKFRESEGGGAPDAIRAVEDNVDPIPILVIDDFNVASKENEEFVEKLLRDASKGVVVFLLTFDKKWATKLTSLNGGVKIKPLAGNVENKGYDGTKRFVGTPEWNDLQWSVNQLRELIGPFCLKHSLDKAEVVPNDAKYTPKEAMATAKLKKREKTMQTKGLSAAV